MNFQGVLCVSLLSRRDNELGVFVGDQVGLVLWVMKCDLEKTMEWGTERVRESKQDIKIIMN